jgi:hypothetical protein
MLYGIGIASIFLVGETKDFHAIQRARNAKVEEEAFQLIDCLLLQGKMSISLVPCVRLIKNFQT